MTIQLIKLTLLCCWVCNAFSLDTTLAFSENAIKSKKLYINIINPLDTEMFVNISAPNVSSFTTKQELVLPKAVSVIEMVTADFEITGTGKSSKGILIQSNVNELIITGLSFAFNSGDKYFARNASQLGTVYIVITHCDLSYDCQFTVIADEDNAVIEIMFPQYFNTTVVFDGTVFGPGDVMEITLQKTQTFQIQSMSDLSGVKLRSTNAKLFSVLSGSSLTSVLGNGRDYIADMVPPIAAWGREYILVRRNLTKYLHDRVKFMAAVDGANISIIGCGLEHYYKIPEFNTYVFIMTCERVHVISDEPVLIAHFPVGNGHGDPAMFFPTPVNHFDSGYTVYIPPGFQKCMISCVIETKHTSAFNSSTFMGKFTQWQEIYQSVYSTTWGYVSSGVMQIAHTSPFGGHVLCEDDWTIIAFPLGLGNWIRNETQDLLSTTTIDDSSTRESVLETTTQEISTTEVLESTTGSTDPSDVSTFTSTLVSTGESQSTYANRSSRGSPGVTLSSNTVGVVTTSQIHSNVTDSALNCSCCKTPSYSDSDLPHPEVLLEIIAELKKTLSVPKNTTSNYVRKLTSAWDTRTSSAGIGVVSIVILCVVFGSIAAIDIATFSQK